MYSTSSKAILFLLLISVLFLGMKHSLYSILEEYATVSLFEEVEEHQKNNPEEENSEEKKEKKEGKDDSHFFVKTSLLHYKELVSIFYSTYSLKSILNINSFYPPPEC